MVAVRVGRLVRLVIAVLVSWLVGLRIDGSCSGG